MKIPSRLIAAQDSFYRDGLVRFHLLLRAEIVDCDEIAHQSSACPSGLMWVRRNAQLPTGVEVERMLRHESSRCFELLS